MSCDCEVEIRDKSESRVLIALLAINAVMFVFELVFGWVAQSTGLIADSLDMFADAAVYAVSLYAVGKTLKTKSTAAAISGVLQLLLGLMVFIDITRRLLMGSEPHSLTMIAVSAIALAANTVCIILISKHKDGEVHMRASWIFTKNDVLANLGVIGGGLGVRYFQSPLPDLLIGAGIAVLILHGGVRILNESLASFKKNVADANG